MRLNHWVLVSISSFVWLALGLFLLNLGAERLLGAFHEPTSGLVLWLGRHFGPGENGSLPLFALAIVLGLVKGRTAMRRAVQRGISRILSMPNPASLFRLYSPGYYILLISMMGLGMLMRVLNVPGEIRGTVLVAVGCALIMGGVHSMRCALRIRKDFSQA